MLHSKVINQTIGVLTDVDSKSSWLAHVHYLRGYQSFSLLNSYAVFQAFSNHYCVFINFQRLKRINGPDESLRHDLYQRFSASTHPEMRIFCTVWTLHLLSRGLFFEWSHGQPYRPFLPSVLFGFCQCHFNWGPLTLISVSGTNSELKIWCSQICSRLAYKVWLHPE